MESFSAVIVLLMGVWLIGLAMASVAMPERAKRFLGGFASSAFTHLLEMFLRIMVGAAFVIYAPQMRFSIFFTVFGWILLLTTAVLLFVPWKLHRRFADWSLPMATGRMMLFGFVSFFGGFVILLLFFLGPDTPLIGTEDARQ